MARTWRIASLAVLVAAAVVLWVFPLVLFPHPATNEAIALSNLEWLVLLAGLAGVVVALIRLPRAAAATRIGLGIFLLGVAAAIVIGLFAFGNFQDDRFLPLLFLPFPIGGAGVVALAVGLALSPPRGQVLRGATFGVVAAAFVCAWILVRGSRDWLLAPYGFDVLVLILVAGAAIVVLSRPEANG
ncbi:MAG TPA: hypothetical protein VMO88_06995 [Acidimicrobiales bacterium]|nr:hypothetical protein [Acidimicrobiales bacterium]